jgi:hypothetical protein
MVLSVYDIDDYRSYFDVHPIRKIPNETLGYDCLVMGTRLGIGFMKNGQVIERPQFELDVKGRIRCIEMFTVSDERVKSDIEHISPDKCSEALRGVGVHRYVMKDGDGTRRFGFVAQQLETQPTLDGVVNDSDGNGKSVDTVQLLALAIGAINDLAARLDAQDALWHELAARSGGQAGQQPPRSTVL